MLTSKFQSKLIELSVYHKITNIIEIGRCANLIWIYGCNTTTNEVMNSYGSRPASSSFTRTDSRGSP
jgi:hypothetical protein